MDNQNIAEVILTWFIQIIGLTAGITFGVFSALSWSQAVKANYEAASANTIALVAFCSSQNGTDTDHLGTMCMSVTNAAQQSLLAVASSLFPSQASTVPTVTATGTPSAVPTTTSTPSPSKTPNTHNIIIGTVAGTFAGIACIVSILTFCRRSRY